MAVILTDYPKPQTIDAHLRGIATDKLLAYREQLLHTMMAATCEEAGGYVIVIDRLDVEEELRYRKVPFDAS